MSSAIEVSEKTVNERDVVAFSKLYNDEEHEVFAPVEHAPQIVLQLLATINDGKEDESDQFVLVRKSELGNISDGQSADTDTENQNISGHGITRLSEWEDTGICVPLSDLPEGLVYSCAECGCEYRVTMKDRMEVMPCDSHTVEQARDSAVNHITDRTDMTCDLDTDHGEAVDYE